MSALSSTMNSNDLTLYTADTTISPDYLAENQRQYFDFLTHYYSKAEMPLMDDEFQRKYSEIIYGYRKDGFSDQEIQNSLVDAFSDFAHINGIKLPEIAEFDRSGDGSINVWGPIGFLKRKGMIFGIAILPDENGEMNFRIDDLDPVYMYGSKGYKSSNKSVVASLNIDVTPRDMDTQSTQRGVSQGTAPRKGPGNKRGSILRTAVISLGFIAAAVFLSKATASDNVRDLPSQNGGTSGQSSSNNEVQPGIDPIGTATPANTPVEFATPTLGFTPTPTESVQDKLKLEAEAARLLAEKVALELPINAKEINDPLISYTDPNAPKLRLGYPESNIPLATNIGDLMRVANGPNAEENLEIITKSLNGMEPFALYIFESGPFPDGTLPDTLTKEALNLLQNAGWQIILTPNRENTTVQDQRFSAHELFSIDPKLPNPRFGIATGTDFSWIYSTDEKYLIIPPSKYPFYMIQEGDEEGKIEISGSLVIGNSIKNIQKWDEFVQSFNPGYESQTYFIRWPVNANAINLKGYEASGMIIIPPNTPPQRLAQLLAEHYGMGIDLNQLMSSILVGTTNIDD